MLLEIPSSSIGVIILEVIILLVIDVAAFVGNLLVCVASYRNRRLRRTTNVFVFALAITDVLASCITAPLSLGAIIRRRWMFGKLGCRIQGFFTHFLIYTSMYTLSLTAINRYFRIVKPRFYKKLFGGKRSVMLLVAVWLFVALFVSIPPVFGLADFEFQPGISLYTCILDFNSSTGDVTFLFLVLFLFVILSMTIIISSYIQVFRAIHHHKQSVQALMTKNRRIGNVSVEEIKITRTLFILVMAFAICWIPVYSVVAIIRTGLGCTMTNVGSIVATYLIFLSSAINPYIYAFNHRTYRVEFKKILSCKKDQVVVPVGARVKMPRGVTAISAGVEVPHVALISTMVKSNLAVKNRDRPNFPRREDNIVASNQIMPVNRQEGASNKIRTIGIDQAISRLTNHSGFLEIIKEPVRARDSRTTKKL